MTRDFDFLSLVVINELTTWNVHFEYMHGISALQQFCLLTLYHHQASPAVYYRRRSSVNRLTSC